MPVLSLSKGDVPGPGKPSSKRKINKKVLNWINGMIDEWESF
jgi:hypothetical protein